MSAQNLRVLFMQIHVFLCDHLVEIVYLNMCATNTLSTLTENGFIFKDRIAFPCISVI